MNVGIGHEFNTTAVPLSDRDKTAIAKMIPLVILVVMIVMSLFLNILHARVLLTSRKSLLAIDVLLLGIAGVDVFITVFLMPLSLVADREHGNGMMLNPTSSECIAVGKLYTSFSFYINFDAFKNPLYR